MSTDRVNCTRPRVSCDAVLFPASRGKQGSDVIYWNVECSWNDIMECRVRDDLNVLSMKKSVLLERRLRETFPRGMNFSWGLTKLISGACQAEGTA